MWGGGRYRNHLFNIELIGLTMTPPQMKAKDTYDFIFSKEGKKALYFLNNYLRTNAELRRKRQLGLWINYESVDKILNFVLKEEDLGDKLLAKRNFCIEIIAQTMMSLEDLAAFCLAFEKPLEDLLRYVIGYQNKDINHFYQKNFDNNYFSYLLLLPSHSEITDNKELIRKIEIIQNQNIEAFNFHFRKFVEYRDIFGRFYNKNKHGNSLFLNFAPIQQEKLEGVHEEDLDVVIYYDSEKNSDIRIGGIILGRNTIEKSMEIMRHASDILVTLIHRRLDYLKYDGNYPPVFIFGENPLEREDWRDYKKKIECLLPLPTPISFNLDASEVDVKKQYEWLHSEDWGSKWFKQKDWEFEEESKVRKSF